MTEAQYWIYHYELFHKVAKKTLHLKAGLQRDTTALQPSSEAQWHNGLLLGNRYSLMQRYREI